MPILTYVEGFPMDNQSLGASKVQVRNNLDGTFETLGIDHVNNNGEPGSNPAGYHTLIHQVTQSAVSTVAGVNQIFSGIPGTLTVNSNPTQTIPNNGDTQLYSLTGMGGLSQLTGHNASTNGYVWISGILLQWGKAGPSGTINTAVNLNNAPTNFTFPNNIFGIWATAIPTNLALPNNNPGPVLYIPPASISTSGFSIGNVGAPGVGTPWSYYWLAIGN